MLEPEMLSWVMDSEIYVLSFSVFALSVFILYLIFIKK